MHLDSVDIAPVERLHFRGSEAVFVDFRCARTHPYFAGRRTSSAYVFAFPYRSAGIRVQGARAVVADASCMITIPGCTEYGRHAIDPRGDASAVFGLRTGFVESLMATHMPGLLQAQGMVRLPGVRQHVPPRWRAAVERVAASIRSRALPPDEAESAIVALFDALFGMLAASSGKAFVEERFRPGGNAAHVLTFEVMRRVNERLSVGTTLTALAAELDVDLHYLCRVFRKTAGVAFHDYLAGVRIARALCLLDGRRPIAQVASSLGFASHSHFAAAFKRYLGVTPRAFAKDARLGSRRAGLL